MAASKCNATKQTMHIKKFSNTSEVSTACRYAFMDTPGQIEAFTWSASGDIMTKMCVRASRYNGPNLRVHLPWW